jgi:thymidylate synthase (FAD)
MKITLMDYTKDAVEKLIFTKRTRLNMTPDSWREVVDLSPEEKEIELNYVLTTIGSSLEFVDYMFLISGVSRAFTHQLVRHRVGVAFAQQAQRVVNMTDFDYIETGLCKDNPVYHEAMERISYSYQDLLAQGVSPQDARGVLPTNIATNIVMKINLRSLMAMAEVRLCYRAQGEYQSVMKAMAEEVLAVHPWLKKKLQPCCIQHGYCLFPRFLDCPMKEAYPGELTPIPESRINDMIHFYDNLGVVEFQPTGKR